MSGAIFNNPSDNYIFTGSRFRAGSSVNSLRLSKGNNTYIDICENFIDISAISVLINNQRVITQSSTGTVQLGNLIVQNVSAGSIDISTTLNVTGATVLRNNLTVVGDVSFGGRMNVPAEFTIDPSPYNDNIGGKVIIKGDLQVDGTTTTINSNRVDISDLSITLASNATSQSQAVGAGFDICGTGGASFRYAITNSIGTFQSTIGLGISGNLLPLNNTSQVPVSYNTFSLVTSNLGSALSSVANTWETITNYTISKVVLSNNSYMKMEFKVNFLSSTEADQTLGFQVERSVNGGSAWTSVFTDPSLGSNMGVGVISVYNGTYIDNLNGASLTNSTVTYRFLQRRNLNTAIDDAISTSFGVIGGTGVGNYIFLQELYRL
jgi:hypothetical protein